MACNYNASSWKVEAGPEIQGLLPLYSKFEASLGYMKLYFKKYNKIKYKRGWGCTSLVKSLPTAQSLGVGSQPSKTELRQLSS